MKVRLFSFTWMLGGAFCALVFLTGCNMPGPAQNALVVSQTQIAAQATLQAQAMQESAAMTQQALAVQATALSEQAVQNAQVSTQAAHLTQVSLYVQQTLVAQVAGGTPVPPTSVPPAKTPTPMVDVPSPTPLPTAAPPPLEERMKDAKILVYENIVRDVLPRYVKEALDQGGYTYVDAGDASGFFKAQLFSGTQWDLVIAAMESRQVAQGEFWGYLNAQLDQGTAVIIETWNLDDIGGSSAAPILERCGAMVQSDWHNPPLNARALWWLVPQSPIFHQPNDGFTLISPDVYWSGDAGDLLMLTSDSNALLLAGISANSPRKAGTLISCMDGQLLLQTFSTHDYRHDDIVALWQNYIYNTLKAHFESLPVGR